MLKRLCEGDIDSVLNAQGDGYTLLRIKALLKAYKMNYDFVSFYGNDDYTALCCLQDSVATLYIADNCNVQQQNEACELLNFVAGTVLSDRELLLTDFQKSKGSIFTLAFKESKTLENVSDKLDAAFDILSQVFSESINKESYDKWYTELSYRTRHGMSRAFTLKGICTATAYLCEDGRLVIAQLATMPQHRGKGFGKSIMLHAATELLASEIIVLSQNETSNEFYKHCGFEQTAQWYMYER